jgi:DNA-binding transcriptional MerR regulator
MSTLADRPQLHESGTVARRLGISLTGLFELERRLPTPAPRTSSGRRLFDEQTIEALQRLREARALNRRGSVPREAA